MSTIALRITLEGGGITKTIQFSPQTTVFDACKLISDKFAEAVQGKPSDFGLFMSDEESRQGVWLESKRTLDYYMLRDKDTLEYRRKNRKLKVRMLDGAVKTIEVDDSQTVDKLMLVICTKIGITNYDEYGLVREDSDAQNENIPENKFSTLTLRRKLVEKNRDTKMETLRKKIKTDDDIKWVDNGKTLREQGIDESETVLLKRKFFFSDRNIDSRDPVQLNLLYVQARNAILDGTHPVTQAKACEFAGIQVHIQFGPHDPQKHKVGFLNTKDFLPYSYIKTKGIEKQIFAEHRKHFELSEIDAKVLYTKTARELPTYGVTFFLVREKVPGKNKLTERLLGVTKDSVLRLDEKTKEILQTFDLTCVRRWNATPNTFTLDFGDYQESYYSVQTTEGEQIVRIIAGYIDIILKRQQAKDHIGIEGDEGSTMVEESVAPSKATFIQNRESKVGHINIDSLAQPGVIRTAVDGERPYSHGQMQGDIQYGAIVGQVSRAHNPPMTQEIQTTTVHLTEPQRALLGYISAGQEAISRAEQELTTKAPIPDLGSDLRSIEWRENALDHSKQAVTTHISTMNAATAQIVTATQPDEVDTEAISASVTQIAQNIPEVTKQVRLIAALMEDENNGDNLLDAARQLCNAFSDLLKAAEPENSEPRQKLINAATKVGEATSHVLSTIEEESPEDRSIQDTLIALAQAVANSTAALVLKGKEIAIECQDEDLKDKVFNGVSQCFLATSKLYACAKVVAPTLHNAACRDQLETAAKQVLRAVNNLVSVCNEAIDDPELQDGLLTAARDVSQKLQELLDYVKLNAAQQANRLSPEPNQIDNVIVGTDMVVSATDPQEMISHANEVGKATARLIQSIKNEAEQQESEDMQHLLLAAAKQLADATSRLIEAARSCKDSPNEETQQALRHAARELREITTITAHTPNIKRQVIHRLENAAKNSAAAATQCVSASQSACEYSTDEPFKQQLTNDCKNTADYIRPLVQSLKGIRAFPDNSNAQLSLIESSEQFIEPASHLSSSARGLQPTVENTAVATQLSRSALNLNNSLHELRTATLRAREACSGQELESAIQAVRKLGDDLVDTRRAFDNGSLLPLPGETVDSTSQDLTKAAKNVSVTLARLLTAVTAGQRQNVGAAGRDTAVALGGFTKSIHGVAATTQNPAIIDAGQATIQNSARLLQEAQRSINTGSADLTDLTNAAKDVKFSLQSTTECVPGHREVNQALSKVSELSEILSINEFPTSNRNYNELQNELKAAAEKLSDAGGQIVGSYDKASQIYSPVMMAATTHYFARSYQDLLSVSMEMAGQTTDEYTRTNMVECLRNVSTQSCSLLSASKSIADDPSQPNARNLLTAAARSVTESINKLVDACISAAPGQKECDNAIRSIEQLRNMLEHPSEPINEQGYFDCVDNATKKSQELGYAITEMINNTKESKHVEFGHSVSKVSESIHGLIESAAQAAYLIGVSHPSSSTGRPGIIDQTMLNRTCQEIFQNCENLYKTSRVSTLAELAKKTTLLCGICRQASLNTVNSVAKSEFINGAKLIANATADLVNEVRSFQDERQVPKRESVDRLLDSVRAVNHFASSPEFISIPAKISAEGRRAQDPILSAGRGVLNGVIEMVKASKSLVVSPDDPPIWQQLSGHSKPVSESVKRLIDNIRDKAPGQAQCDQVLQTLATCTKELDTAAMAITAQRLTQRKDNNLTGFSTQTLNAAGELLDKLESIRNAAKYNAEHLGHAVGDISRYVVPMVNGSIGACTHIIHSNQQIMLINQTKSVVESAAQLVQSAKESGGNQRATEAHFRLDENIENTRDVIKDLTQTVEKLSAESGIVTGLMEQVNRSIARLTDKRQSLIAGSVNVNDSFVDYQTRMVQHAKEIARLANEMNMNSQDSSKLPQLGLEMTQHYSKLTQDSMGATMTTTSPEVGFRIRDAVISLGRTISKTIQSIGGVRPNDSFGKNDISINSREVCEKVAQVLLALQAGSKGTQACINAAHTVSGIIGDLDTTIMFATAGTLNSDGESSFASHREHILQTARALVEDTKALVTEAAGTQDALASAAQNAVSTIIKLADAVKAGACSLGSNNPDSQVMVINAVKDVASALGDLINATKLAAGKPVNDPSMQDLKDCAKVMVQNVTSLLNTVREVENENTRGSRALESTVQAITQEIRSMNSPPPQGGPPAKPEDLIRVSTNVTLATAKAVAAGASKLQADYISAATHGRRAISELLIVCRSVAWTAETEELRQRTIQSGAALAEAYKDLINGILHECTADERMHLSRRVAKSVTDLVALARLLKGSDWVDPEDPTVIAENELLGAAASIDAAALKLKSLRPRRQDDAKIELDQNMNFDALILTAAHSIMTASAALVRAANAAQRELIDQGKVERKPLSSSHDGQWSEGLISAARFVASAAHSLVEAAQKLVVGQGTEELLISSAKQVAYSTAQLLIAFKVKGNPNSEAGRRLQMAGTAVTKATENLVKAAQQALDAEEEHSIKIHTSMVDGMAQEIDARSEVLSMEKKLEEARSKLKRIQQAKYHNRKDEDDSDNEYHNNSLNRSGVYNINNSQNVINKSPTMLNYQNQNQQQNHPPPPVPPLPQQYPPTPQRSFQTQPQHFHYPDAVNPTYTTVNKSPIPPQSPSFLATQQKLNSSPSPQTVRPPPNPKLTGNSIPRPYPGSPTMSRSAGGNSLLVGGGDPKSPSLSHHSLEKSSTSSINNNEQKVARNLEACVQDLHDKTFGQGSVVMTNRFKQPGDNGFEGFTTRYETRHYEKSGEPLNNSFSQMSLHSNNGQVSLVDDNSGSERLSSMTQRVMERKTYSSTTESRTEKKTEQHSFRLE